MSVNSVEIARVNGATERRVSVGACHCRFSSAVYLLETEVLTPKGFSPVTPEVASSSLVDPAIFFRLNQLHC